MGKAQRVKRESARERIAAQQAAAKRAESRRRIFLAGGAVIIVIAIVVGFVVAFEVNKGSSGSSAGSVTGTALPASVIKNVTTVPASALNSVGTGSVLSYDAHPVTPITGTALTSGGKPEMLYIGAEFCPYCAEMRWSMAIALSHFGTLSPLHGIRSASGDTWPDTATLTYYKSSYSSPHLAFVPVENQTRTHTALQPTTAQQTAIWDKYEPDANSRGYPFIDFGNKFMITSPIYDGSVLQHLTWQQISVQMRDPSSKVAQGILGAANFVTAGICKMTNGQPGAVCSAAGVTAAAAHL